MTIGGSVLASLVFLLGLSPLLFAMDLVHTTYTGGLLGERKGQ
jgi:hypothetical protein